MIRFTESDMEFELHEDKSCHIEETPRYQAINRYAVSSVECVTLHEFRGKEYIVFIEAKRSAPNPGDLANRVSLSEYMESLKAKYEHSIQMCYSALHEIDKDRMEIGHQLLEALKHPRKLIFILIARELEDRWCREIQAVLTRELQHLRHIWNADVVVINEALAQRYHLIV